MTRPGEPQAALEIQFPTGAGWSEEIASAAGRAIDEHVEVLRSFEVAV